MKRLRTGLIRRIPAQDRTNTGREFVRIVGLYHVVISPEFKAGDHVIGIRKGRHEDKRDPRDITEETTHLAHVQTVQRGVQQNETRPKARDGFDKWSVAGRVYRAQTGRKVRAEFVGARLVVHY